MIARYVIIIIALLIAGGLLITRRPPIARAEPPPLTFSLVGDIMLADRVGAVAKVKGTGYLLAGVKDILTNDDLTIGNLECAIATVGTPAEKQYTFRADPAVLPGLRAGGVEAVSLANNHTLDYGRDALLQTLEHLTKSGIAAAGAGRSLTEASRPVLFDIKGRRVAFLAASRVLPSTSWYARTNTPGLAAAYDPARLLREVKGARATADVVIVYLHWGIEQALTPEAYQRKLARQCIDAGADLVVGSHPHVLQGFEYHKGKLIAYSLGNFVFSNHDRHTAILQVTFGEDTPAARIIPCAIVRYCPTPTHDPAARAAVLRDLERRSYGARIAPNGLITPVP
ncbi:MAG: Capsule biosynthesis protein CapA [bacterium ADurb.Bin429]|nr:MAG: Capsule biosynthesis protein CapA [bacterium ADurb.Bin429]